MAHEVPVNEHEDFIQAVQETEKPLLQEYTHALWEAATTGSPEANQRQKEAQAAHMRFWADQDRFALAKRLQEAGAAQDPLSARLLKVIYLSAAKAQQDEESIERITELEAAIREQYYNFRAKVDGQRLTDNELDEILRKSSDPAEVHAAWEASKQIGARVAPQVRELARVRNRAAHAQDYRDHFERSLILNEIEEAELFSLLAELEAATREPFTRLKAEIDRMQSERFGLEPDELRPWHYGDRFFQDPPYSAELDLDLLFADKDPVELATATYDGLGLEVRDILERSDLYERNGKNQHAFCLDLDREGDIRTLNNLLPNQRWNETLLHELGHAVYNKYIDRGLPWSLRKPPHMLSTEAIAILMGSLTYDKEWLVQVAGASSEEASRLVQAAHESERAQRLVFARWVLVMTHFERGFYADPEQDLDRLWWDMVERYQQLRRPKGRSHPDWAAKFHIPLAPVYYHNYQIGVLFMKQISARLREEAGGLIGRREAGRWLQERVFWPGASMDWATHIEYATGERLNPQYFVRSIG